MALTPKLAQLDRRETTFVSEYLVDLDPKRAAIAAGYSKTMAGSKAYQWVSNSKAKPHVFAAVQAAMDARAQRTEITADRVLKELAKVGFTDLADVVNWGVKEVAFGYDGDGKQLRAEDIGEAAMVRYVEAPFVTPICRDDLTPTAKAAVAEVSLGKDGFKIKMHDKNAALVSLGRHLGMFNDKVAVVGGGPGSPAVRIENVVTEIVLPANGRDEGT